MAFISKTPKPDFEGVSTKYDDVFRAEGQGIPLAFLRALAWHESRLNPLSYKKHVGLFQIGPGVRKDWNKSHKKAVKAQYTDPALNTRVAAWHLNRIIAQYNRTKHPALRGPDWMSPEWVKLLLAGWNVGWGKSTGVPQVAKWLKSKGAHIDHDAVMKKWRKSGAHPFGGSRLVEKWHWHRKVYDTWVKERRAHKQKRGTSVFADPGKKKGGGGWLLILALAWMWSRK